LKKPSLQLLHASATAEEIAALFEKLTGRKPTDDEMASGYQEHEYAIPQAHFGAADAGDADWRSAGGEDGSQDGDDDEELEQTPADVTAMLGFDPAEAD
jgi:hypothetical protein